MGLEQEGRISLRAVKNGAPPPIKEKKSVLDFRRTTMAISQGNYRIGGFQTTETD